jgi:hypothetical protein
MLPGSEVEKKLEEHEKQIAVLNVAVTNHIPTALATLAKDLAAVRNWIVLTLLALASGLFVLIARGH